MRIGAEFDLLAQRMATAGVDVRKTVSQAIASCRAKNTKRGYDLRQQKFQRFCSQFGLASCPADPSTVLAFLALMSEDIKAQCLSGYRLAIRALHVDQEIPDPTGAKMVMDFMMGNRRNRGTKSEPKTAFKTTDVREMCAHHDVQGGLLHIRAKAMLLTSFAAMLRTSEAIVVRREHLSWETGGILLNVVDSKTDTEAKGMLVAIAAGRHLETCPVQAIRDLIEAVDAKLGSTSDQGFLFPGMRAYPEDSDNVYIYDRGVSDQAYRRTIKQAAKDIGLNPVLYSGHSCRSGHASEAARNGAQLKTLMVQGRWLSPVVAASYIQTSNLLRESTSHLLGL